MDIVLRYFIHAQKSLIYTDTGLQTQTFTQTNTQTPNSMDYIILEMD